MDIDEAIAMFEEYVGEPPTPEEVATLEQGLARGRRMNRVIAGLMSSRYHRRTKGPDAMRLIRANRGLHRGGGRRRGRERGDLGRWRQALHAAIDAFFDVLDERPESDERDREPRREGATEVRPYGRRGGRSREAVL